MASLQAAAPTAAVPSEVERSLARLRERCGSYFADFPNPEVRLIEERRRPQSLLLRCELIAGEALRRVIVKVPTAASPLGESANEVPRVAPLPDPRLKPRMEYLALKQIYAHFAELNDPRFGAVRVLDMWADTNATVMEEARGSNLRSLLSHATRFHPNADRLIPLLESAGAWLARFQGLPPHELCRLRGGTRDEFLESIARMTEFLAARSDRSGLIVSAGRTLRVAALSRLPDSIPLGLSHGDFAPRNVLVGEQRTVTVIDTLARFEAPIYEDLGYFLNDLHTARLQTCALGAMYSPRFLSACRDALLRGWSRDEYVSRIVSLFEAQALLDRWCARVGGRSLGRPEFFLTGMHFSRRLRHLCSELTESA